MTLDYKALLLIVIKKATKNQDPTCSTTKKIVLGGRGLSVEFCVFCTAIRVSIDRRWLMNVMPLMISKTLIHTLATTLQVNLTVYNIISNVSFLYKNLHNNLSNNNYLGLRLSWSSCWRNMHNLLCEQQRKHWKVRFHFKNNSLN